jgi:Fe-S-cluster formation regulator IscX/YfhJ
MLVDAEARVSETTIAFTELLGRRVRMGPWEDQKVSTYRKILDALDGGRWDEAARLGSYFVDEANVCFTLYRQWIGDLNGFL